VVRARGVLRAPYRARGENRGDLILKFKAPEPGAPLKPPVTLVLQEHEFVTHRYVENHLKPPSTHVVSGRPKGRKSKAGTLGPAWMVAALAARRCRSGRPRDPAPTVNDDSPHRGTVA